MDSYTLNDELDNGEAMGLNLIEIIDGKKHLNDLCVVNSGYGPSYPCSWFIYDKSQNIVWESGFSLLVWFTWGIGCCNGSNGRCGFRS